MFALFGWFLLGGLLGGILTSVLTLAAGVEFATTYGMLIVYPVQFIPAMMFAAYQSRRNALFDPGYELDSKHFGKWGFLLCALVAVVSTLAMGFVGDIVNYGNYLLTERSPFLARMYDIVQEQMKQLTGGPVWLSLLTTAVLAPVFEEWLCRGEVLRGLLRKMAPGKAIALSALFFAVLHLNPWQALNAFVLGCLFGYVYYRTGSLWLTMLMHFANNALSFALMKIPSVEAEESMVGLMPVWGYVLLILAGLALAGLFLWALGRIPLQERRGNMDTVTLDDLV
jgi:membrane protease YdiL (CAAX protease family)